MSPVLGSAPLHVEFMRDWTLSGIMYLIMIRDLAHRHFVALLPS